MSLLRIDGVTGDRQHEDNRPYIAQSMRVDHLLHELVCSRLGIVYFYSAWCYPRSCKGLHRSLSTLVHFVIDFACARYSIALEIKSLEQTTSVCYKLILVCIPQGWSVQFRIIRQGALGPGKNYSGVGPPFEMGSLPKVC